MRVFVVGATAAVGKQLLTEIRDASNAKARRELGWQPRHPSWRRGFAA
jgi:nucleoside-diphosphate-sugar epimerase